MKYMLGLMMLLPMMVAAQLYDDFADGNLYADPTWQGDTHLFEVNNAAELWLNAPPVSGSAYLSTPSAAVDTGSWSVRVRMDFNPSSSNYTDIVLMSDSANLSNAFNGYFVRLGGTEDEVSLWRKDGSGEVELIDGLDDVLDENQVEVQVLVERGGIGQWQLWADTGNAGNFILQGNVVDETHTTSHYFGLKANYTATRSDKFFFDDITVTGAAYADTLPPLIESVNVPSPDSVLLQFSEALDASVLLCDTCFQVGRSRLQPSKIRFAEGVHHLLMLGFSQAFREGQAQQLRVSGVRDLSGNTVKTLSSFTYYRSQPPATGDLIINEILADPEPQVGLPHAEYIEVFNRSNGFIALNGLELTDASSTGVYLGHFVLAPQAYAILCSAEDSASLAPFGSVCPIDDMPTLNNSSDELSLRLGGVLLDTLRYDRSWYQDEAKDDGGFSIERINPGHPCSGPFNWTASTAAIGGTPGSRNSVFDDQPDLTGPVILRFEITDPQTIVLHADESFTLPIDLENAFRINEGPVIDSVVHLSGEGRCSLVLSGPLEKGEAYTLTVKGLMDCFENSSDTAFRIGMGVPVRPFDLVFSELRPAPVAGTLPLAEYIELYNRTDRVLTTHGLRISDASSGSDLPTTLIWPKSFVLLVDDGDAATFASENQIALSTLPSLNNSEDALFLHRYDTLIDAVQYEAKWAHPERQISEGWALERISMDNLCDTRGNWTSSASPDQGTPGVANSVASLTPSEGSSLEMRIASPTEVVLRLEERLDSTAGLLGIINGEVYAAVIHEKPNEVRVNVSDSLQLGTVVSAALTAFRCDGVLLERLAEVYLPKPQDVVINEVLFNPKGEGSDYVEVFNRSAYTIDLSEWSLPRIKNDSIASSHLISDAPLLLPPGGYLAFADDEEDVLMNYPFSRAETLHQVDLPSYPNDAGNVVLANSWGQAIDRVDYDADMHFELLDDPDGVALERIHPDLPSNASDSWTSASSAEHYGTPGYENSQFVASGKMATHVALSQLNLSPDGDGVEDVLLVEYDLPFLEGQLSASVYTDDGALVHQLASNRLVGSSGALTWNGLTDRGQRAATGIHIMLVEVFHTELGLQRYKLPFTVRYR